MNQSHDEIKADHNIIFNDNTNTVTTKWMLLRTESLMPIGKKYGSSWERQRHVKPNHHNFRYFDGESYADFKARRESTVGDEWFLSLTFQISIVLILQYDRRSMFWMKIYWWVCMTDDLEEPLWVTLPSFFIFFI